VKPNWGVIVYLSAVVIGLSLTGIVAVTLGFVQLYGWLVDPVETRLDELLIAATIVTMGILPWPGLLALAKSIIRPAKLSGNQVETEPIGTAVAVIIALNEEEGLSRVVHDFFAAPEIDSIIVVDNGSTDRTREIGEAAGARVVVEERRGYGYACIRGLSEALRSGHDAIILCEGDGTFRAADARKLMAYLPHADLAIGSRTHAALLSGDSQLNSFTTLGNLFVAKLLQLRYWDWNVGGRVRLTDVGCTYRAIRATALRKILPALQVGGNYFGPHMVMVALEHGLRVIEAPITFWKRVGVSKGGNANWRAALTLGLQMIFHITTYRVDTEVQPELTGANALEQTPSEQWR